MIVMQKWVLLLDKSKSEELEAKIEKGWHSHDTYDSKTFSAWSLDNFVGLKMLLF